MVLVLWKHSEDNITPVKIVIVKVPAYIKTQARLNQLEFLSELGEYFLYCDTVLS